FLPAFYEGRERYGPFGKRRLISSAYVLSIMCKTLEYNKSHVYSPTTRWGRFSTASLTPVPPGAPWRPGGPRCQSPRRTSHRWLPAARRPRPACPAAATGGPGWWRRVAPRIWPAGSGQERARAGSRLRLGRHPGGPGAAGVPPGGDTPPSSHRPAGLPRTPPGPRLAGAAPPRLGRHAPWPPRAGPDRGA